MRTDRGHVPASKKHANDFVLRAPIAQFRLLLLSLFAAPFTFVASVSSPTTAFFVPQRPIFGTTSSTERIFIGSGNGHGCRFNGNGRMATVRTNHGGTGTTKNGDGGDDGSKKRKSPTPSTTPLVVSEHFPEVGFTQSLHLASTEPLYSHQSKYQKIQMFTSEHYGKILVLDGVVQLTEGDAAAYNEMMAHVPMMEHPEPKRVLIIGGGDGYVLSEVLKHPSVQSVDLVELDRDVVDACRVHFPWTSNAFDDSRSTLHVGDGCAFAADAPSNTYDVIIQDSSDPFAFDADDGTVVELPSSVLFTREHFANARRMLRRGGIFSFQSETYHLPSDVDGMCKWRRQALDVGFESARYGSINVGTYPLGQIGFTVCKTQCVAGAVSPDDVRRRFAEIERGLTTKYYWPGLQHSCFDLPYWVHKRLYDDEV